MRELALVFMFAAAVGSQVLFAQESQPSPRQPSALVGTDSPEALREHIPVLPAVRAKTGRENWPYLLGNLRPGKSKKKL